MKYLELAIPPLPSLLTVGHAVWLPGNCHFKRSFDVYDVILVKRGAMYMQEDGTEYAVNGGQLLVLEPGKTHAGSAPCTEETEVYWVHFKHPKALRSLDAAEIPWSAVLPQGHDSDTSPSDQTMYLPKYGDVPIGRLQPLLNQMVQMHMQLSVEHSLQLQTLFCELLKALQTEAKARPGSRASELARETVSYLQKHWTQPFHSKNMEESLHFQFDHLTRCMKKYTGMTPLQYVQYLRISHAVTLLEQTTLSVQEIAERVGIPSVSYFGRLFRERIGISPGQYRNQRQYQL
ncbi:helix-turn-helix domain-containing protein [Paenibacillus sp. HJL G12]|uniref:Helix-turn-helix domain-containing protein n=1 Tax=Paenibacillus dendrobii TaxID=2691084 RepID=A0A7X3IN63_9BACL|nr:AraC family transcriptional regulator [Paenibacillus dendrobii]MWV47037.1 helix-turn-helix domain-containing protein [Paenibacillus dendrobii]